jgi:hypothetical protein
MNAHPNGTSITDNSLPINSFHAVAQHAGDAVVAAFGDPMFNESFSMSQLSREQMELPEVHLQSVPAVPVVNLGEFPRATGEIRGSE